MPARRKAATPVPAPKLQRIERDTVINMKGSTEYVAWLDEIHHKTHIPKVRIFRLAIAEWAKRHGHDAPPAI